MRPELTLPLFGVALAQEDAPLACPCPFRDATLTSAQECLDHLTQAHGINLLALQRAWGEAGATHLRASRSTYSHTGGGTGLDQYACIRFVNYLRQQPVRSAKPPPWVNGLLIVAVCKA